MLHEITILEALFSGLVLGCTEWLPMSGSEHFVIFSALLNAPVPPAFDIVIMAGTIAALIRYTRKRILMVFTGILSGERNAINQGYRDPRFRNSDRHYRFCRMGIFSDHCSDNRWVSVSSLSSPVFSSSSHQRRISRPAINREKCTPDRYRPGHRRCSWYFE